MLNRNYAIDFARWIFAFFVVSLHVSFWHRDIFIPIARCAVPFFFMVTGYFLLDSSKKRFLKSAKKWFGLWLKYTLILFVLGSLWDCFYEGRIKTWTFSDTIGIVLSGSNTYIDEHVFEGNIYGISTLWFLYAGCLSTWFLYLNYKHLFKTSFNVLIGILLFGSNFVNYVCNWHYDEACRVFFLAIPFMYMGGVIRRTKKKISMKWCCLVILVLWILGLFEVAFVKDAGMIVQNIYIMCIPMSVMIFYVVVNSQLAKLKTIINSLPVTSTLDIYVWHRLVYFVLIITNCCIAKIGAVEVFLITAIFSLLIRFRKNEK